MHVDSARAPQAKAPYLWFYIALALVLLGGPAIYAGYTAAGEDANRDLWQHIAAINALRADLLSPENPYVSSDTTSRHFQPFWVVAAILGNVLGASNLMLWAGVSILSAVILAFGVYVFARSYEPSPYAPHVLLFLIVVAWPLQVGHTGFTSFSTLLFGIGYPATTLIGLSMILWALVSKAFDDSRLCPLIVALVALMVTTHQLGALIGLVVAGCYVLLWPHATTIGRVQVSLAILLGMIAAAFWPYFNPYALVLRAADSSWDGGPDFYGIRAVIIISTLFAFSVFGFGKAKARPIVLAALIFLGMYLYGLTGNQIASRFLMPTLLMLFIGLLSVCLKVWDALERRGVPTATVSIVVLTLAVLLLSGRYKTYHAVVIETRAINPTVLEAAQSLTAGIDNDQEIAAHGNVAWPIVALGQAVHAIPWPEPGIVDLTQRQLAQSQLFTKDLTKHERLEAAQALGLNTLIVDTRKFPEDALLILDAHAAKAQQVGPFKRYDLAP